jgi:hypothetical protein
VVTIHEMLSSILDLICVIFLITNYIIGKGADLKSVMSGSSQAANRVSTVNFQTTGGGKQYDAPTLKRLNPELYKEFAKQ